jgi:RHS repeat-associated protein
MVRVERAGASYVANNWHYAGVFLDGESGLYLLDARYYDPSIGRFLQQDPVGSGALSPYAYAQSDLCNNSDPTGLKIVMR